MWTGTRPTAAVRPVVGNGSNTAKSRRFSAAVELDFLSVSVTAKTTLQQRQCIYL
jgi:hypothetical protein